MQLFNVNSNVFQNTLLGEYDQYKKQLKNNTQNVNEEVRDYFNGDMLFSINQNSQALTNLLQTNWNITTRENEDVKGTFRDGEKWLDYITESVIKVEELHTFKEAVTLLNDLVGLMGDTFAGALLVHGKTIINPLHPLSALILVDNYEEDIKYISFKIVVYTYSTREAMKSRYRSSYADKEKITENIRNLISLYSNKQQINKTIKSIGVKSEDSPLADIEYLYAESMPEDATYTGDFIMIPHTLITKGIAAPYYGTSVVIREDDKSQGAFLTPFQSANISSPFGNDNRPEFNSVCTGSKSQITMEGLRTLNHANLSSPLNSSCIGIGALEYADECIKQSLNLYKLGGFINDTENNETTETEGTNHESEQELEETVDEQEAILAEQDEEAEFERSLLEEPLQEQANQRHNDLVDALRYGTVTTQTGIGTIGNVNFVTTDTTTGEIIQDERFQPTTEHRTQTFQTGERFFPAFEDFTEEAPTEEQREENFETFQRAIEERADQIIFDTIEGNGTDTEEETTEDNRLSDL